MFKIGISRILELKKPREIIFSVVYIRMGIVKKVYTKAKKAIKKRYYNKKTGVKLVQVAKDVMMLKNVLNPEKKRISAGITNTTVGQLYNSSSGMVLNINAYDMTPNPPVGTGYADRNGASVKLHSSAFRLQFVQQDNAVGNLKLKVMFIKVHGVPLTNSNAQAFLDAMFIPNPFVSGASVIDYHSQFNPDKRSLFSIIRQKTITLRQDTVSGQKTIADLVIPLKYNNGKGHHVRWDKNTSTILAGQIFMIVLADRGNQGGSASSGITGVADTAAGTGAYMSLNLQHFYYDN